MLRKRIIFTLLFNNGNYMLSRNFLLQQVGNLDWLRKNYNFFQISCSIDELIVLNVSRDSSDQDLFSEHIKELTKECFIPIAAGGGIRRVEDAKKLLRSGADKVVLNTPLFKNKDLVIDLSKEFGNKCLIGSIDYKMINNEFKIFIENGSLQIEYSVNDFFMALNELPIGEIYLNSMDRDGTGQGYEFEILNIIKSKIQVPLIMAGGAGNYKHLSDGLINNEIDAVATAHLFNFVGTGLIDARKKLIKDKFNLPEWSIDSLVDLKNIYKKT